MKNFIWLTVVLSLCPLAYGDQRGRSLPLPGDPGAVVNADFDQDGFQDLAMIVAKKDESRSIIILWGDLQKKFSLSTEVSMQTIIPEPGLRPSMRDTTSRSIVVADFNGDGKMDLGTSVGMALNQGTRKFSWVDLKNKTTKSIQPVGLVIISGQKNLVVRVDGGIDACTHKSCTALIRSEFLKDGLLLPSEMIVFDFDNDKKLDILAGSEFLDAQNSYLWLGKDLFKETYLLQDVSPVDIQLFDINGDGRIDFLAQVKEFISDFPSETRVFLNKPEGLELTQTFSNFDNHNDNATVMKKSDGCFKYYQIGVDRGFGVLETKKNSAGECVFESVKPQFKSVASVLGIGIQCLSLSKDRCHLVARVPMTSVEQGSLWIEN
ncbi:MAG: FG-GAP repeat domain-containing protein [Pseudobdellovibrionaceae bacterium]